MIVGMDFGTTNSGMAVFDGRRLRQIPVGPAGSDLAVDRTALYVTNDQSIYAGGTAIDRYLDQNVGRPVKMERVRVGTIEVVAADVGTYYEDVYAEKDVLSPGRLFVSFKSFLSSVEYHGTIVGSLFYSLEDIVSTYLNTLRIRAERFLQRDIRHIVLGRPVVFAGDRAADALAQQRLVGAALRAGYDTVYLQYEPVAAAFHFEASLDREQTVLVFDFGGGTLDVTIMRMGNPQTRRVLATGGIPVAGDVFDQRIVRRRLARHFGEGSSYASLAGKLPIPTWVYDSLSDWQAIVTLQHPQNLAMLDQILTTSDDPRGIRNLIALAARNYGLTLYTTVEDAKRRLSDAAEATISFDEAQLAFRETMGRRDFEALIQQEIGAVEGLLQQVVRDAGLSTGAIDAVVRTGGSSQIPIFVALLNRMFGEEKVRAIDAFSSVTSGLAVAAQRIATGELESPAHTRSSHAPAVSAAKPSGAAAIDPGFLTRWVVAQELAAGATAPCPALTRLTRDGRLVVADLPALAAPRPIPLDCHQAEASTVSPNHAALGGLDDQLLLMTSWYRFLITTPRRIAVLRDAGLPHSLLERLDEGELLCTLAAWGDIRDRHQLVVVTSYGFARLIEMELVRSRLERSIPFSLERRDESYPVAVVGVDRAQDLAVITSAGRVVRVRPCSAALPGVQVLRREKDETIVASLAVRDSDQILLVTAEGAAKVISAALLPVAAAARRAKPLSTRLADVRSAIVWDDTARLCAVTSTSLRPLDPRQPAGGSAPARAPFQLLALEPGEQVTALLSLAERHAAPSSQP